MNIFFTCSQKKRNYREEKNIVISMAKAKRTYKELIIKAHPDKNPNNIELAKKLSEKINKYRYNYIELMKLKIQIENELSTNIK